MTIAVTTKHEIRLWLQEAKDAGATHMLVVCDTFDHEDYPVKVMPNEDVQKKMKEAVDIGMTRLMEVYSLRRDFEEQLNERYAWHPEYETTGEAVVVLETPKLKS